MAFILNSTEHPPQNGLDNLVIGPNNLSISGTSILIARVFPPGYLNGDFIGFRLSDSPEFSSDFILRTDVSLEVLFACFIELIRNAAVTLK
jgi:hypothetical protein